MPVTDLIELNVLMARVKQAQALYAQFTQAQVDVIFRSAALAAANARIPLARLALTETGMGVFEDKVVKNHFASEYIYHKYKDEKTCGVLSEEDIRYNAADIPAKQTAYSQYDRPQGMHRYAQMARHLGL